MFHASQQQANRMTRRLERSLLGAVLLGVGIGTFDFAALNTAARIWRRRPEV